MNGFGRYHGVADGLPGVYVLPSTRGTMKKHAYLLTLLMLLVPLAGCAGSEDDNPDGDTQEEIGQQGGDTEENIASNETGDGDEEAENSGNLVGIVYSDATLNVTHGNDSYEFIIKLNHTAAPIHTENFRSHISEGNYDGTPFHRIIDDFVIQGGDIENNDGSGGYAAEWHGFCDDGDWGSIEATKEECPDQRNWNIPDEVDNGLKHEPCTISMAHSGPNTGGSQFFITPEDVTNYHLDGIHTVFGEVIEGCGGVTQLSEVMTGDSDRPITPVSIFSADISETYVENFGYSPSSDVNGDDEEVVVVPDYDGDGIGDEFDHDDDNDNVNDSHDAFPLDANESADTDLDGIGDNADEDDDGDGVNDTSDEFPLDPSETVDIDGDGIGDNADTDDDNDGIEDSIDDCPQSWDILALRNGDYFVLMMEYGIGLLELSEASSASMNNTYILDWDGDGCWMFEDHDDDGDGLEEGPVNGSIPEWWLYTPGDNCVIVANPDQTDTDDDGRGDACDDDDDGDGVADSEDDYPLDPENS